MVTPPLSLLAVITLPSLPVHDSNAAFGNTMFTPVASALLIVTALLMFSRSSTRLVLLAVRPVTHSGPPLCSEPSPVRSYRSIASLLLLRLLPVTCRFSIW